MSDESDGIMIYGWRRQNGEFRGMTVTKSDKLFAKPESEPLVIYGWRRIEGEWRGFKPYTLNPDGSVVV